MMLRCAARFASLLLVGLASGCLPATLLQLNNEFVDLMQTDSALSSTAKLDGLAEGNYDAAREGLGLRFKENGDRAVEAADKADTPANKVSFLNVAARSFLKSGPIAEGEVPGIARRGQELCADDTLKGLGGLPATCTYFYMVEGQVIANEMTRKYNRLALQIVFYRNANKLLPASEGPKIVGVYEGYAKAVEKLADVPLRPRWGETPAEFRSVAFRQMDKAFCYAMNAGTLLRNVEAADATRAPPWNRDAEAKRMEEGLADLERAIAKRPGGFDKRKACASYPVFPS